MYGKKLSYISKNTYTFLCKNSTFKTPTPRARVLPTKRKSNSIKSLKDTHRGKRVIFKVDLLQSLLTRKLKTS